MAKTINLDELRERRRCRVRYGRARLTIVKWGSILLSEIEPALRRHADGGISADEVAWVFVRERVPEHTPSFSFDDADLGRLLPLVVGCSEQPKFKATTPEELVAELEQAANKERESMRRTKERLSKTVGAMQIDWMKAFQPALSKNVLRQMTAPTFKLPPSVSGEVAKQIRAMQPGVALANSVNAQLASINTSLLEAARISKMEALVQPSVWRSMSELLGTANIEIGKGLTETIAPYLERQDLSGLTRELLEAAREAEESEAAETLEAAAETLDPELTVDEIAEAVEKRIKPQFAAVERRIEASSESSADKFLWLIISAIIALAMQAAVARMGVPIEPPEEPVSKTVKRQEGPKPKAKPAPPSAAPTKTHPPKPPNE